MFKSITCVFLLTFSLFSSLYSIVYLEKPVPFNAKVEIVGCFIENEGKFLVLHRKEEKSQGNLWGIPGGKLEKGETPIQASIRETEEETGYHIPTEQVTYLGKVYIKYPNFDYVYHMVRMPCVGSPGDVKISYQEHKGFTWVTPQDALDMKLMLDEDTCIKLIYEETK